MTGLEKDEVEGMSSVEEIAETVPVKRGFAVDSLEAMRKRLLDLTGRNRLLNFHHGRGGHIRVVDEFPDQLHKFLLDEKSMVFKSFPEPSQKELVEYGYVSIESNGDVTELKPHPSDSEWAKQLGLKKGYDLLASDCSNVGKNKPNQIQTLLSSSLLETRLRGIHNKARTAIEESGTNILFLAFGFLEWYESPTSEKEHIAPLYLVPVQLERGSLDRKTGTYNYSLTYTGEDLLPNLSLREKLRQDFGMALPDLDDAISPEEYFSEVGKTIISSNPRWKIRRYCTLSLFHFGKLLMYLDLDPDRWPNQSIVSHKLVRKFFATSRDEDDGDSDFSDSQFGEERDVDSTEEVHVKYPLIDDADSSQHSALMDAMDGKNLVIEGPPGTGKSQTITNLIAAAMAEGKKVLFVADKLAALEVVKSRLDRAGLGEFCLELHSHKTQKRQVLDDLSERLGKSYRNPSGLNADIARYEELKEKLFRYAELINSPWKNTGKSCHEILMKATRYRSQFKVSPSELHPEGVSGESFSPEKQRAIQDDFRSYREMCEVVGGQGGEGESLLSHPWFGVGNQELNAFETSKICDPLKRWQESLVETRVEVEKLALFLNIPSKELTQTAYYMLIADIDGLPMLQGNEDFEALPFLDEESVEMLEQQLLLFKKIQEDFVGLTAHVEKSVLENPLHLGAILDACKRIRETGISTELPLSTLSEMAGVVVQLQKKYAKFSVMVDDLVGVFGSSLGLHLTPTQKGLESLRLFLETICRLPENLWDYRDDVFEEKETETLLVELQGVLEKLRPQYAELSDIYNINALPSPERLRDIEQSLKSSFFGWLSVDWWKLRKELFRFAENKKIKFRTLHGSLESLINYLDEKKHFDQDKRFANTFPKMFDGLNTRWEDLQALYTWYWTVRMSYGRIFGASVAIGEDLLAMESSVASNIQSLAKNDLLPLIKTLQGKIEILTGRFPNISELKSESASLDETFIELAKLLEHCLDPFRMVLKTGDLSIEKTLGIVSDLECLKRDISDWDEGRLVREIFCDRLIFSVGANSDSLFSVAEHTLHLAKHLNNTCNENVFACAVRKNISNKERYASLKEFSRDLSKARKASEKQFLRFKKKVDLDFKAWIITCGRNLDALIDRNELALSNPGELAGLLDYLRLKDTFVKAGFASLIHYVEAGEIHPEKVEDALSLGIYDCLAKEIFEENKELELFSGYDQNAIRKRFCEYDEKLKKLQCKKIAWKISRKKPPRGNSVGRVSEYTDLALIQRECEKKKRHIPLRQLVRRAGDALIALKPCFMMGPMSVAQYLKPGELEFDLVVMDEASQVKPQDALGMIARGRQLVVVGDPKQLPPTSFFDRAVDEDDEHENMAIEESESILDAALPMFDARRLRWHYRSRHESLIAFSNHNFYGGNLIVFPSPHSESAEFGVKLTHVEKGCFVNRRNLAEADAIAKAVIDHLKQRSHESIGVVAMSSEQRDQIDRSVEELCKQDPLARVSIDKNSVGEEPLFIKNLENVQGDERDVIFISCTYGPPEPGARVFQRFGPINSDVGWRRLNVLFTRSKKRMHVFTSMEADDIVTSERSSRGVVAFKNFLAYVKSGRIYHSEHTGDAPDSDFEIDVMERLMREGFECEPQVGVAGFFIDLAVKDPNRPGRYLMGVECDGASYHSAKSARDRDRLRQEILERLGWTIRRIWSTDWFKNPDVVLKPIVRELHKLKTKSKDISDAKTSKDEKNNVIEIKDSESKRIVRCESDDDVDSCCENKKSNIWDDIE